MDHRYCFFGDTVNTAARMESTGAPMCIQMSEKFFEQVEEYLQSNQFKGQWKRLQNCQVKGKGLMNTVLASVLPETDFPTVRLPNELPAWTQVESCKIISTKECSTLYSCWLPQNQCRAQPAWRAQRFLFP